MNAPEMNNLAKDWVTALRSGEYEQTKFMLRDTEDGFCCLGVACNVYDPKLWGTKPLNGKWMYIDPTGDIRYGQLSNFICEKLGIDQEFSWSLSNENDKGATFPQIAEYIERYFQGLPWKPEVDK